MLVVMHSLEMIGLGGKQTIKGMITDDLSVSKILPGWVRLTRVRKGGAHH